MYKITSHPILDLPKGESVEFLFEGHKIKGIKGHTIAAALHQAGYPVHNHSLKERNRTLECGIGKCGACEMLVDGHVRRICITKVDGVKKVERIGDANSMPANGDMFKLAQSDDRQAAKQKKIHKTTVAIIGTGPAGLAVREELNKAGVDNLVIDNNSKIGGQFKMQTHQFFFFEKEKKFGGMRGFDIAKTLAGESSDGIMLNSVVWDILQDKRLAIKNIETQEVSYVDADQLVVAAGALPFMPAFKNDDLPGVYTAAVVQKMMNTEFTLLGKNILTVGAGNIGYLTSYQAIQAGAHVKAIIEGMDHEGGFPVQANRVRRLGIPIMTSRVIMEAIPNKDMTGITGAIIAECKNFKPIAGTEKRIDGIDCINICTGLLPDNQLLRKGNEVFGRACRGVGDAVRIGEGTSAVLRGKQCAYEIMEDLGTRFNYDNYLSVSKEYIDSQQHPIKVISEPDKPSAKRMAEKGFVIADCLYGFACNPCSFSCKQGAITKSSTSSVPVIDYDKCIGCMECVTQCPGLAIFGYRLAKRQLFLPIEFDVKEGSKVFLVDDSGKKVGEGTLDKVVKKQNKTNTAIVSATAIYDSKGKICRDAKDEELLKARGFITKENYPEPLKLTPAKSDNADTYVCFCEDVKLKDLLETLKGRTSITARELKHITRIGMGVCRGSRCLPRAKQVLKGYGIEVTGEFTPRGPMANLVEIGNLCNVKKNDIIITTDKCTSAKPIKVGAFVAGGGMAGTATFRYLAEAGYQPVLINKETGSSWRCIGGGRPAFSVPALADIANGNLQIFRELQKKGNIDFKMTRYISFAHDEKTYKDLDASRAWSKAYMIEKKDFQKEISEYFNPTLDIYTHALISEDCWQATPGRTIDLVRQIGIKKGGIVYEDTELVEVRKVGGMYHILVKMPDGKYQKYESEVFVNALGPGAEKFARQLGIETHLYPVRHQAFITKRLPLIGREGDSLDMLIDRRNYKGFSAVYGQQFAHTGQIIGCASPENNATEGGKNLKVNTQEFIEIVSEVFTDWIPKLKGMSVQATWCGYYTEPRYIIDPQLGLFVGMRGHGFMLSQYIGKLYVDALQGKKVPDYFKRLGINGDGLAENAFA
ncbi:MAG TPA: FAD-dependent oxidoreductase [Candidatus Egerieousia sp.]|nr:FAD-dependent oxidoreductase [Candidatus Egerieousia sp.]HPT05684.1 FAD-dependent oxidoreductase [Candidatus Egerieousia sp.]